MVLVNQFYHTFNKQSSDLTIRYNEDTDIIQCKIGSEWLDWILKAWVAGVTSGFTATTGGGGGAGGEKPSFSTSYNNNGFVASITRDRYTWGHISIRLNQKINLTSYARIILSYAVSGYLDSVFFGIGGENSSIAIKSSSKKYTGNTSAPSEEIVLDISNVSGEQDIYIYLDTPNAGELNGTKITGTCTIKSIIAYITD